MDIRTSELEKFIESRFSAGGFFHALIISGDDEAALSAASAEISAAIVCSAAEKPCRICQNCKKAFAHQHPDIIITSLPGDRSEITVGQIRDIVSTAEILPNDADNKVYIIENADKTNPSAQNALLKVLEEPPRFVYFILLTSNPGALLPTVRSRCALLRLISESEGTFDEKILENAENLIKIYLSGDKFQTVSFINGLDKYDRRQLDALGGAVKLRCIDAVKAGIRGKKLAKLVFLMKTFDSVSEYADANVSPVHILGFILSQIG